MLRTIQKNLVTFDRILKQRLVSSPISWTRRYLCTPQSPAFDNWKAALDEENQTKLAKIGDEIARMNSIVKLDELRIEDLDDLLSKSSNQRKKFYRYLLKRTAAKQSQKRKKELSAIVRANQIRDKDLTTPVVEHIEYGLNSHCLFNRLTKQRITQMQDHKLAMAIFSKEPNIIFDCGFDDIMAKREQINTAKQLAMVIRVNRDCARPFVMHLCNLMKGSPFWGYMEKNMPTLERIPVQIHGGDITSVVPPENLVYLTPDSEHVLETFNPMDTYVIGSIVDRGIRKPYTLPKAQRLGIRTARLPIDKFKKLQSHKELTLDQVMRIMVSIRHSDDWKQALGHIAKRKYVPQRDGNEKQDDRVEEF